MLGARASVCLPRLIRDFLMQGCESLAPHGRTGEGGGFQCLVGKRAECMLLSGVYKASARFKLPPVWPKHHLGGKVECRSQKKAVL